MRAVCAPTAPSPAGATTTPARRPRPTGNTPPSPPAGSIRARCAPTAPSPAGASSDAGQATAPDGQYSAVTAGWGAIRAGCAPTAPSPAGASARLRAGDRARRAILRRHRRRRRRGPFVRAAHQRHHHLLGTQRRRAGDRARRAVLRRRRRRCGIRVGCAPTAPSPAGDATTTGRRPRRPGSTPPSPPGCSIRAGYAPTAPSPAGDATTTGRRPRSAGQYSAVTAGAAHSCGLRTNGTITCWGANFVGEADAPDGQYSAVAAGVWHSCGLRTDGTITCWGHNEQGQATAPAGQYSAVTAGWHSCEAAHRRHHHLLGTERHRAGDRARRAVLRRSPLGTGHSCGLRTDGTITCWGSNRWGQATACPRRVYSAVAAPQALACPLRAAWWRSGSAAVAISLPRTSTAAGGLSGRYVAPPSGRLRRLASRLRSDPVDVAGAPRAAPRGGDPLGGEPVGDRLQGGEAPARISPTMWRASGACSIGRPYRAPRALPAAIASRVRAHDQAASRTERPTPTGQRSTRRCRWTGRSPRPPPRSPNRGDVEGLQRRAQSRPALRSDRAAHPSVDHLGDQDPVPLGDRRRGDVDLRGDPQALVGLVLGGHAGVSERDTRA